MHLHFERNANARCDCAIMSLTWMGKVPDELPEDEGWKLNRTNYYQEGWLATGNVRGIVGVTFTTSHCKKAVDFPLRTNYNLRGHRSEVMLVKWNEPYQKLASCDSSGIIFVWIKYEGRWSIELINDRNTPVTHFAWSHDGRMALICYQDGFVLVGSVAGQRYWSSMLNLESTITCGIWTPDDQQVYFGTTAGQIIVMDVHGAMVSQVQLASEVGITGMAWSCEKFKMEEGDDLDSATSTHSDRNFVLAVSLLNGYIFLMKSYDDVSPTQIHTGLQGPISLEWSNSRELLAVAGTARQHVPPAGQENSHNNAIEYTNALKFYNEAGVLLYSTLIPECQPQSHVTALTWGHNDKRLFIATGCMVHIAWVSRRVASLQLLCRLRIRGQLRGEAQTSQLPLPARIKTLIANLFAQTIRCCVPDSTALRHFVSRPPDGSVRLHCTMIRHDDDTNLTSGTCYTLYLEYLGGLVPLLKGKRTSKIRPEFVIYDPQVDEGVLGADSTDSAKSSGSSQTAASESDSDREDGCASPRVQRRRRRRNKAHAAGVDRVASVQAQLERDDDLTYIDTLPEHVRLVEVTSNIWGTKFKIHGLAACVPANLGQVTYKTSLLHLQPRQMTLLMTELRDDLPPGPPDPSFNPNLFSEDEDDISPAPPAPHPHLHPHPDMSPAIAPMTPQLGKDRRGGGADGRPRNGLMGELHARGRDRFNAPKTALYSDGGAGVAAPPGDFQTRTVQKAPPVQVPSNGADMQRDCFGRKGGGDPRAEADGAALAKAESYDEDHSYVDLNDVVNFCETLRGDALRDALRGDTTATQAAGYGGSGAFAISQYRPGPATAHRRPADLPGPPQKSAAASPGGKVMDRPGNTGLLTTLSPVSASNPDHAAVQRIKSAMDNHSRIGLNLNLDPSVDLRSVVVKRIDLDGNANRTCQDATNANNRRREKCGGGKSSPSGNQVGIAATKWCVNKPEDILYIDEEANANADERRVIALSPKAVPCVADSMVRSCSVGYLDLVDAQLVPCEVALLMLRKETPKRLVLVNRKNKQRRHQRTKPGGHDLAAERTKSPKLKHCRKSKSLDSGELFPVLTPEKAFKPLPSLPDAPAKIATIEEDPAAPAVAPGPPAAPVKEAQSKRSFFNSRKKNKNVEKAAVLELDPKATPKTKRKSLVAHLESLSILSRHGSSDDTRSLPPSSPCPSPRLPRSQPASPMPSKKGKRTLSSSPIRNHILNSPLLNRRKRSNKTESSDEEVCQSGDEVFDGKNYRDLESFQKSQLRQKLLRGKGGKDCPAPPDAPAAPPPLRRREFVMHNKAPMWNENSQVYQLDFGGRVTQESAKNFQIEFRGKQVMQFGRIDGNAYTLDFQYPFSALQAFAVALANVTQRLK